MTVDPDYPAKQRSRVAEVCAPTDNSNLQRKSTVAKSSITSEFISICLVFSFVLTIPMQTRF